MSEIRDGIEYTRCVFCHELLIKGPKLDTSLDDITHGICSDCWEVINRKFIIKSWTEEEIKRCWR